jgi:outer membrane protein OmpA-like peptidoglycan-associated protein
MTSVRATLLCGAAFCLLLATKPADAAEVGAPLFLAQATTEDTAETQPDPNDPVAIAQKEVDDARAALRQAMATGGDVRGARRTLQAALKKLNEVRTAAGLSTVAETPSEPSSTQDAPGGAPPPDASATAPATPPDEVPTLPDAQAPQPDIASPVAPPPGDIPTIAAPAPPPAETAPPQTEQQATPPSPPVELPTLAVPQTPTIETLPEPPPAPAPDVTATQPAPPPTPAPDATVALPPEPVPPPEAGKEEEKPGFFKRLFGGDKQQQNPETAAAPPSAEAPEKEEPRLPIFKEFPPLAGPKVVTIAPGDASVVQQEDEGRIIVKEGGKLTVKHDDNDRFRRKGEQVKVEPGSAGTTVTTVTRPGGVEIVTVRDARGDILQRYRKQASGEIEMLIGDRDKTGRPRQGRTFGPGQGGRDVDFYKQLPKLTVTLPPEEYIVPSRSASRSRIEEALIAPPVETIERPYSLDEIRGSERLRAKLRRIDIDTVNFEFGAATVGEDQVPNLQAIGNALAAIIGDNPNEVFLIEGHTDAVGSDLSNLGLSDRRAESIAEILTYYFNIPPENLVTQGYGEQYLKVLTSGPERQNRRAAVRRLTPLLAGEM